MKARGAARRPGIWLPVALAAFFAVIQFYTSFAALSPTPRVGYLFATRALAGALVAVLVAAALVAALQLTRDRLPLPAPSRAMLAAWIGSAALSSALGFDPASSAQVVGMMVLAGVFHLALVRYYDRPGVASAVIATYLVVGLVATLAALAMVMARRPAPLWAFNHGRAAGVFVTANQFAAFLIAFTFVALGVALARTGALRNLARAGFAAALAALLATFSQAGWIGAAAGGVFFAVAVGARRTALGLVVAGALIALVVATRPAAGHNPAEAFDRVRVWHAGVRVAELFPLTGVGPMAYWRVYPAIRPSNGDPPGTFGALHPHDAYLSLAGETGAVGLAACAYGWWRFGRAIWSRLKARTNSERRFALGICAALVAVLVQGIFDTIGIVQMTFVWIPFTALAFAAAGNGAPPSESR